jgi:hypothetical protein
MVAESLEAFQLRERESLIVSILAPKTVILGLKTAISGTLM